MIDPQLVDRVAHAIKTHHDLGNDWNTCASAAICEVTDHVLGRQKWPALNDKLATELSEAGKQARSDFESSTK